MYYAIIDLEKLPKELQQNALAYASECEGKRVGNKLYILCANYATAHEIHKAYAEKYINA